MAFCSVHVSDIIAHLVCTEEFMKQNHHRQNFADGTTILLHIIRTAFLFLHENNSIRHWCTADFEEVNMIIIIII